ncbi:hypothetical protein [Dankookia sp. P2]|uniref:hypothetical protein n=1 Tax=Dankookia sp. P2 TaxID=3423955 RepID=UPI003D66653A
MRRDDQSAALRPEQRGQVIDQRQVALRPPQPGAGRDARRGHGMSHRSPGTASAARMSAAATPRARSGGRLAQIGGEVSAEPLQRVWPQEGRQADRALRQFQHVERRPLHRRPGEVGIGRGIVGGDLGLGPQGGGMHPEPRRLCRQSRLAEPSRLVRVAAAASAAEMLAQRAQYRFQPAALDGGEAPGASGEIRLPQVVARVPNEHVPVHREASEIHRAGRRGTHALGGPAGEVGALSRRERHQQHPWGRLGRGLRAGGDQRPRGEASA